MAIVKKFNPNQIYLSKKLSDKLKTIYDYPVTIIEAPTGYGKTTAVKEYLKTLGKDFIWFNIDSGNREKMFFDFCEKIKGINEGVAHKLMSIGYPSDEKTCHQTVDALNTITYPDTTVFVVDNYQFVSDNYLDDIISALSASNTNNVRIVILTQAVNSKGAFELVMSRRINYMSKSDFEFDRDDVMKYYKVCGIKLEEGEADFLYQYTEGWISALYLQMLSYVRTNSFEMTADIENLIGKAIWYNLDRVSREVLIGISVFNSFTLRQCIYIWGDTADPDKIEQILNSSGFIRYDAKEGKYFMHSILKYFLDNEFDKMENIFKKEILKNAGNWYRDNELYGEAISFYHKIKDYEAMLSMDYNIDVLYEVYLKESDKQLFMDVTTNLSGDLKKKYIKTYMLYVYFLFLENEREYYGREC